MISIPSARPRRQQNGAATSTHSPRSAPIGGWNSADPKDLMPPEDAVKLVNWFPRQRDIVSRPGYVAHCNTAAGQPVRRLVPFEYGAYSKLLGCVAGQIIDCTTDTPSVLASGKGSDYYSWCQLSGRVFMANGVDDLMQYGGIAVSTPGFTGVTLSLLNFVHVHKKRFYAIEKNTQAFWYGAPSAISGALAKYDLSTTGRFAGKLMLLTTISTTGGTDPDDLFVAIFSSGDVAVYAGSDPGDAADWREVGVFKVGRPLSRFGLLQTGNDVIALTDKGYESLRVSIREGLLSARTSLLSKKIQQSVSEAIKSVGVSDQWSIEAWPIGQMEIVQLPDTAPQRQHVRNFNTGAWCEFDGLSAVSWCRLGSDFYFGTKDGRIRRYGASDTDDGAPIRCDAITAWDGLGSTAAKKHHTLQRLEFESIAVPEVRVSLGTDFQEPSIGPAISFNVSPEISIWDEVEWDDAYWSSEASTLSAWVKCPVARPGRYSALRIVVDVGEFAVSWNSVSYLWIRGGVI